MQKYEIIEDEVRENIICSYEIDAGVNDCPRCKLMIIQKCRSRRRNHSTSQTTTVRNCTLDNNSKLYAPTIDHREENRACFIIKCNWLDPERTNTDHLKRLLFFFFKAVIVVGGFALIFYCYFFEKKLFE